MKQFHAGCASQEFSRQMALVADACRCIAHCIRAGARGRNQVVGVAVWACHIDGQHEGDRGGLGDRCEVSLHVVGKLPVDVLIDGERAGRGHQEGVAVACARPCLARNQSVGAGAVVDQHIDAQGLGQALGEQSRSDVDTAAGGLRDDQPDRLRGPACWLRVPCGTDRDQRAKDCSEQRSARVARGWGLR